MQACAVEATVEIKIMAGDELLCRIPKMTDGIGDGVSLRKDTTQQGRQLQPHCPGQLSGDLAGPLPVPLNNETYFSVCVKRTREWFHTDRGGEFFKHMDHWLQEKSIWNSTAAGCDPQANGMSEAFVAVMAKDWRSLSCQAGAPEQCGPSRSSMKSKTGRNGKSTAQ